MALPIAAILEGAGKATDKGSDIYTGLQNLRLNRRAAAEDERMNRFRRLMELLSAGTDMQDRLSGQGRLFALRNPGV